MERPVRHLASPALDGHRVSSNRDCPAVFVARAFAPDEASLRRVLSLMDRAYAWSEAGALRGERPAPLTLRRDTDLDGRRIWAMREQRDRDLPYADLPRSALEIRPSAEAREMLRLASAAYGAARERVRLVGVAGLSEEPGVHVLRRRRYVPVAPAPSPAWG